MGFLSDAWNGFCDNWNRAGENVRSTFEAAGDEFSKGNFFGGISTGVLGVGSLVGNTITFGGANAIGEAMRDSKVTGVVDGAVAGSAGAIPVAGLDAFPAAAGSAAYSGNMSTGATVSATSAVSAVASAFGVTPDTNFVKRSGILENMQSMSFHKGVLDDVDRTEFANDFKNSSIDNGSQKPVGMPDSDWRAMLEAQKNKALDNGSQKPVGMPDSDWRAMQEAQSESKNESASVGNGSKLSDYDKTLMDKLFKNNSSDVEFTESSTGDNGSKLSDYDKTLMDNLFKNNSSDVEFTESSTGDMEFGD